VKHELGTIKIKAEITDENREKIECFQDVTRRYRDLEDELKEHLYAVFLTSDNELIGDKLHNLGTSDTCTIDIKDLVRTAALVNASAVILVHNHPSGNPEPTEQDIEITRDIADALNQIGVELLDHAIISQNNDHSMRGSWRELF
jgi:DNA repair protein RadC